MRTHRLTAGRLLGVVALVAGVMVTVGSASAGTDSSAPGGPFRIDWQACPEVPSVECGTLQVPLDWAKPNGAKITVALARNPADDSQRRIGSLFVNPGGPGAGGAQIAMFAEFVFSAELNARFDIVGIDPRGTAGSTPVRCDVELFPPDFTLFPRSEQQFRQMVRHNRMLGESCLRETGKLLGHVDAVSVARDMEAVRIGLGEPKVNFFGFSYGTQIGANYAELYPRPVRAMVFDSALEHLNEVPRIADEASTVEDAFNRFAAWCQSTDDCVLKGQDVGQIYDEIVAAADGNPMPVPGAARPVTGEDIRTNTQEYLLVVQPTLFNPKGWPQLATAIADTRAGDASGFANPPPQGPTDFRHAALAIGCMDWPSEVRNYADMQARMQLGRHLAPHLQGASQTWTLLRCIGWPVEAANPPRQLDVRGVPPILIVNATHDASTTYKWAHSLATQIRGSVVLTRVGDGHTSYFTSPCAREAIDRYLIERHTPEPDQECD